MNINLAFSRAQAAYDNQQPPEASAFELAVQEWIDDAPFDLTNEREAILRQWADDDLDEQRAEARDR